MKIDLLSQPRKARLVLYNDQDEPLWESAPVWVERGNTLTFEFALSPLSPDESVVTLEVPLDAASPRRGSEHLEGEDG